MFQRISFALALSLAAGPGLAATEDEASRLTALFQSYLGGREGLIRVTPDGDSYAVVIDASSLLAKAPNGGAGATVSAIELDLADLGDGKWQVSQEGPGSFSLHIPGALSIDLQAESYDWSGVFDEALMAFESQSGEVTGLTLRETIVQPAQPEMNVAYQIEKATFTGSSAANPAGAVDSGGRFEISGLTETFTVPPTPQMPVPMDVTITADSYVGDGTFSGLRVAQIVDLWATVAALPDKAAMEAEREMLTGKVGAALPFFDSLASTGTLTNTTVVSPMGAIRIASAEVTVDMNGVTADGKLHERIKLSGLDLSEAPVPVWAAPLLPESATLDFTLDGFDPAAAARVLLDAPKPDAEGADAVNAMVLAALLPNGTANLKLGPTGVTADSYSLVAEGAVAAGPMSPMPVGSVHVAATGLDAVLRSLETAPPEVSQSAIPGIMMARGLAKPEGEDSYSWAIELSPDGKILVNGVDMSMMAGGAQPQ